MNDATETLLARSLANHAAEAPSDASLLADVHTRLSRRRRARTAGAAVLACAAVATAITGIHNLATEVAPAPAPATIAQPAKGWHWESYANIQIQVPDSWQDGTFSHLWACRGGKPAGPIVGRPTTGDVPAMACVDKAPPVAERVAHVFFEFGPQAGVFPRGNGWTEETRVFGDLGISVFSDDDAIRRQIIDSATLITGTDHYGCSPSHPAAQQPNLVPAATGGLASVGTVESVGICAYQTSPGSARPLLASAELTGDRAREVGTALVAAPMVDRPLPKPGPTKRSACQPVNASAEIIILHVRGSEGRQEVVVRFAECSGNGFDDGTALRGLTKTALQPLFTAVDRPQVLMSFVRQLLR